MGENGVVANGDKRLLVVADNAFYGTGIGLAGFGHHGFGFGPVAVAVGLEDGITDVGRWVGLASGILLPVGMP